jgi:ribose 5-phosphate isomerase B
MTPKSTCSKPIALAADHGGVALKTVLKQELERLGYETLDLGTHGTDSVDYPDYGAAMGRAITDGQADRGIVVCGSGIGISIAANRFPAVRAALCHDVTSARLCREHNDANVLALGERLTGISVALDCLKVFLDTPFAGGRHEGRVAKLSRCGGDKC